MAGAMVVHRMHVSYAYATMDHARSRHWHAYYRYTRICIVCDTTAVSSDLPIPFPTVRRSTLYHAGIVTANRLFNVLVCIQAIT
jgi:hypothetical protein